MEWERLFEDLEDQLASGWEAERAALDAESERLRIARLDLRTRLSALVREPTPIAATMTDGATVTGRPRAVGADWIALEPAESRVVVLLPLGAVALWTLDHGALLASGGPSEPLSPLRERMTLGFVLRDLARRRAGVSLRVRPGTILTGTIDRAGADHLDLALHDAGEPRRTHAVRGFRIVPFSALISVTTGIASTGRLG
ncbi:hypothetical protein J2Y69_000962 [Microbacterium resistens]|uniref:Uncharacterized protein n=1 Tax=Microbacterium resistens TaxID=156977 RepID=A0ABU1S9V8_9MICO|nr:hypothetical protein [Microbacterium resistens]MDR6866370.1 hypothetical protein [Microbacterium resistens]